MMKYNAKGLASEILMVESQKEKVDKLKQQLENEDLQLRLMQVRLFQLAQNIRNDSDSE